MATKRRSQAKAGKHRPRVTAGVDLITSDPDRFLRVFERTFLHNGKPSWCAANEVARDLGIKTLRTVVNLQRAAIDQGLVVPHVRLRHEITEIARLEAKLQRVFGLKDVILVAGLPAIAMDLGTIDRRVVRDNTLTAMLVRLAGYVEGLLESAREADEAFVLGVAWGRTLRLFAEALERAPRRAVERLHVVPIVGITSAPHTEPVEANVIASDIARILGGTAGQLPAPAFAFRGDAEKLRNIKPVAEMLRIIEGCDAVITSMGPLLAEAFEDIALTNDASMNETLFGLARTNGAIGEICGSFFDAEGKRVDTDYSPIGLGYAGLHRLAAEKRVVLISGGDKRRFEPLRVALKARLASVLVSDTVTARYLLGEAPEHGSASSGRSNERRHA